MTIFRNLKSKRIFLSNELIDYVFILTDFDRTGSSPPKQNSQLTTTPYTPGSGQKRFNPFMKDTPSSVLAGDSPSECATDKTIHKDAVVQQQNDENKNIIILDDDNNQNILSTSNSDNHNQPLTTTTPKNYIDDDGKTVTNNDSDSNEMIMSQTETPLPDWIALNESVLIRPYNHSGVISFIGPTHFSVWHQCIAYFYRSNFYNFLFVQLLF